MHSYHYFQLFRSAPCDASRLKNLSIFQSFNFSTFQLSPPFVIPLSRYFVITTNYRPLQLFNLSARRFATLDTSRTFQPFNFFRCKGTAFPVQLGCKQPFQAKNVEKKENKSKKDYTLHTKL
jgi:hypothetical protein